MFGHSSGFRDRASVYPAVEERVTWEMSSKMDPAAWRDVDSATERPRRLPQPGEDQMSEAMQEAPLVLRRTYEAPRERVFRAWTEPKQLERWYAGADWTVSITESALREGGHRRAEFGPTDGTMRFVEVAVYEAIEPPSRLVFTTTLTQDDELLAETRCTVEFIDLGAETELVMTETGYPTERREERVQGWGETLDALSGAVATRTY